MDDLSSPHSRQSISEHRPSDGSLPVSDPGRSPRSRACWASTGDLHQNQRTTSPGQSHQEVQQEHEAQVNRLLQVIRSQNAQIQQLQQQQSLLAETAAADVAERNAAPKSEGETAVLPQENQMLRQSAPDPETPKPPRPITVDDPFPWDFTPEWPVTRAQRIDELQRMAPFYQGTPQRDNIAAAIDWHTQFDPDEIVPADTVIFQRGRRVEESDVRPGEPPWEEGCDDDFVNGDDSTQLYLL